MWRSTVFETRTHAGRRLADRLGRYTGRKDVLVLALPRGGVPVAAEVARVIGAPLDVMVVRRLGVPGHEEVAMAGTYLGARLAVFFSGAAQLTLFAAVMLLAAFFMFREKKPDPRSGAKPADEAAPVGDMPLGLIVLEGIAVGVLTGLVGVGGGFLIVPALVLLGRVPMKQAVGTSLVVIAMKSAAGFAGYLGQVEVDWAFMALFTGIAAAGILLGTWLVQFVPQAALKRSFAVFLLVMGGFILYQNRGVILPGGPPAAEAKPAAGQ